MKRPNILLLTTDGHRADAVGHAGNPFVPSPFHDRMAAEGIAFLQAHAVNPICSPSRCSMMTGVHPLVHGLTCHQNRAPWNLPQLPELLQQAGYYTAAAGHYEEIRNLGRGYHEQVDESQRGPLREAYGRWQRSGREDRGWDAGRLDGPVEESHSYLLVERAIRMLDEAKASGAPFFMHLSFNDPHPPYFAPAPWDRVVDSSQLPLPPCEDGPLRPAWQRTVSADFGPTASPEDVRHLRAVYYGMIGHVNAQLARFHAALESRGLADNTWIFLTSDHGDYAGDKGLYSHTEALYDCLLRVPLVIRPPAGVEFRHGQKVEDLVELTDVMPTCLGVAGLPVPEYVQGFDLLAWLGDGAQNPLRDGVFSQVGDYHGFLGTTLRGGRPKSARHPGLLESVRTRDFRFTRDPDFGDEAYDLAADPHELRNLLLGGVDARQAQGIADARQRLDVFREACLKLREELGVVPGDRGFVQGWE